MATTDGLLRRLSKALGQRIERLEKWLAPTPPPPVTRRPPRQVLDPESLYGTKGQPRSRILVVRGNVAQRVDLNGYAVSQMVKQAFDSPTRREFLLRALARATDAVNIRYEEDQRLKAKKRKRVQHSLPPNA